MLKTARLISAVFTPTEQGEIKLRNTVFELQKLLTVQLDISFALFISPQAKIHLLPSLNWTLQLNASTLHAGVTETFKGKKKVN